MGLYSLTQRTFRDELLVRPHSLPHEALQCGPLSTQALACTMRWPRKVALEGALGVERHRW